MICLGSGIAPSDFEDQRYSLNQSQKSKLSRICVAALTSPSLPPYASKQEGPCHKARAFLFARSLKLMPKIIPASNQLSAKRH